MNGLDELRSRYPWPDACPDVPQDAEGWFCGENRNVLQRRVAGAHVVLELGAWKGMSTRWLAEHTQGVVVTVDHWEGSSEHQDRPELRRLYETFVRNCWDAHRDRLIPMRTTTIDGMREVAQLGIEPDVIYVDASHEADLVAVDLRTAFALFPRAHIVGDDWTWASVRDGVGRVLLEGITDQQHMRKFIGRYTCYEFFPEGADVGI